MTKKTKQTWLVIGDSHKDSFGAQRIITEYEMKNHGITQVIHTGDLDPRHFNSETFLDLPVAVAFIPSDFDGKFDLNRRPYNWQITRRGERIVKVYVHDIYLGHMIGWECLTKSTDKVRQKIEEIRMENDGIRYVFCGHSHFQYFLRDPVISLINPGYVEEKYEYTLLDPDSGLITFTRLPMEPILQKDIIKICVIADTDHISKKDKTYWPSLIEIMKAEGVTDLVICCNIQKEDVCRKDLADFTVHCWLDSVMEFDCKKILGENKNWIVLNEENPIMQFGHYQFFVGSNLCQEIFGDSMFDLDSWSMKFLANHREVKFVLFGGSYRTVFEKNERLYFIDPGDVISSRSYCIIELPRRAITFGTVPRPGPCLPYAE